MPIPGLRHEGLLGRRGSGGPELGPTCHEGPWLGLQGVWAAPRGKMGVVGSLGKQARGGREGH